MARHPVRRRRRILSELESLDLLRVAGLPVVDAVAVTDVEAAVAAARRLGTEVALKLDALGARPQGGHRRRGRSACAATTPSARPPRRSSPSGDEHELTVRGLLVEPMAAPGLELIVGLRRDPQFGPVVLVGLGGTLTEVLDDVAIRLAPIDAAAAGSMLDELRGARLLDGVRGGRPSTGPPWPRCSSRSAGSGSSGRTCSRSTSTRSSPRRPGPLPWTRSWCWPGPPVADEPVLRSETTPWGIRLVLNRPDKLNALSGELVASLDAAIVAATDDPRVRVIVIEGAGRAFSAGYDLTEEADGGIDGPVAWRDALAVDVAATLRILDCPKPVIAQVHGYALAGGLELAMACDLVVAAEGTKLGEPEIRYGSAPVTLLMPYLIGQKKTRELLLTGDLIDAVEAERIGLINRVVPADRLAAEVDRLADRLARTPPEVMGPTKRMLNRAMDAAGFRLAVEAGLDLGAIVNAADTPEQREWDAIVRRDGLKAALAWRDRRYDERLATGDREARPERLLNLGGYTPADDQPNPSTGPDRRRPHRGMPRGGGLPLGLLGAGRGDDGRARRAVTVRDVQHVTTRHEQGAAFMADACRAACADVVDDRGHARAEHLQERAGDVDLGAVREQGDGRLRERAAKLRVREVSEPPLRAVAGRALQAGERHPRVADDEEPGVFDPEHRLDRILRPLVWPNQPEAESRAAVVAPVDLGAEDRVPDDRDLLLGDPEVDELAAAALGVHDDALEPPEEGPPHRGLRDRAPRDDIVRREHRRASRPKDPAVELGRPEPLHVDDVGLREPQSCHAERMLERLDDEPCAVPAYPRRHRVKPLTRLVALGGSDRPEPEPRRHELDLGARIGERS